MNNLLMIDLLDPIRVIGWEIKKKQMVFSIIWFFNFVRNKEKALNSILK
jgi:hypothetical protein